MTSSPSSNIPAPLRYGIPGRVVQRAGWRPPDNLGPTPNRAGLAMMQEACWASGGVACVHDVAWLLDGIRPDGHATLSHYIASGDVFGFEWDHAFWVPMFQFHAHDLSIKAGPHLVREELGPELDGWALAAWFARPNFWLDNTAPVAVIEANLVAVLKAASADCFVGQSI